MRFSQKNRVHCLLNRRWRTTTESCAAAGVSKAAFYALCGELTLVHTSREIGEFSVTSFSQVRRTWA